MGYPGWVPAGCDHKVLYQIADGGKFQANPAAGRHPRRRAHPRFPLCECHPVPIAWRAYPIGFHFVSMFRRRSEWWLWAVLWLSAVIGAAGLPGRPVLPDVPERVSVPQSAAGIPGVAGLAGCLLLLGMVRGKKPETDRP
jgi:hypothetical protein